jgi:hypothetical protein
MGQRTSRGHAAPASVDLREARLAGRVGAALLAAVVFTLFTVVTKEVPSVYARLPWAEDPTDSFVSFALFLVPMCACIAGVRFALCRAVEPPPAARVAGTLGATWVALGAALVTLAADWVGLIAASPSTGWDGTATAAVVGLVLTTVVVLAGASLLSAVPPPPDGTGQPDGLADAIIAGRVIAHRLGRAGRPLESVVTLAERRVAPLIRLHPVGTVAAVSVAFGIGLAVAASREEGPLAVSAFVGAVATCTMFAFLAAFDRWLRLVAPARPAGRRLVRAAVVGAAAVPVSLAFRDAIWTVIPVGGARDLGSLASLVLVAGITAFAVTLVLGRSR